MHPQFTPAFIARFWAKVDKTSSPHGCWLWTAARIQDYGVIGLERQRRHAYAHRVAYELAYGEIPGGIEVCHNCDRFYDHGDTTYRRCVRNDGEHGHLWLGTHTENVRDMWAKGRNHDVALYARGARSGPGRHPERYRGENNGHAKLTESLVRELRQTFAAGGITYKDLGTRYGISGTHAKGIVLRISWPYVT